MSRPTMMHRLLTTCRRARRGFRPAAEGLEDRALLSLTIRVEVYGNSPFFSQNPTALQLMKRAANDVGSHIQDHLLSLNPADYQWGNILPRNRPTWKPMVVDPNKGGLPAPYGGPIDVGADTIVIFVGARPNAVDLGDSYVAGRINDKASTGLTRMASNGMRWGDIVASRGKPGAGVTTTTTWGGSIGFDSNAPWNYAQPGTTKTPDRSYDFYTAALHEIMHILGFHAGNPAFDQWVKKIPGTAGNYGFYGPEATSVENPKTHGPIPLAPGNSHWHDEVVYNYKKPVMNPRSSRNGFQRPLTKLDLAALKDIGWQVTY